jgi:hypothetical protein
MDKNIMLKAFESLDKKICSKAKLLLGGGGAMVLAHAFPLSTMYIDALFYKSPITQADVFDEIQEVANELNLPKDWLNPHFGTFLYTLPQDYESRLITIFEGKHITVNALSIEDLLILKCFAGREKDVPHARVLMKKLKNIDLVENHLRKLIDDHIPKAREANDFFDELLDELDL